MKLLSKLMKLFKKIWSNFKYSEFYSNLYKLINWNRPYYISIVGEVIFNPEYKHCYAGRAEVYDIRENSGFDIDEIRYFTDVPLNFQKFYEKFEYKQISKKKLNKIEKIINEKYNIFHPKYKVENKVLFN